MSNNVIDREIEWQISNTSTLLANEVYMLNEVFNEPPIYFTEGIRFSDNFWDFRHLDKVHNNPTAFKYDFTMIESKPFRVILKKLMIRLMFISHRKLVTVYSKYYTHIKRFVTFLETEKFIYKFEHISPGIVEEYLKKYFNESSKDFLFKTLVSFKRFFQEAQYAGCQLNLVDFENVFNKVTNAELKAERKSNKTANIPKQLLDRIIDCALKDMENDSLKLIDRMMACLILIVSDTGMRKGELQLLETNKLHEIFIFGGKEKAYTVEFFTYKTTSKRDGRWTKTIAYPNTVKAYQTLENLSEERRNNYGTNYLFINSKGERYKGRSFDYVLDCFFLRNQKPLNFESLSKFEETQVNKMVITSHLLSYYIGKPCDELLDQPFYTINTHQFRVAVANMLKAKGLTLQWIREHMNHMDEDMTKHYFRDDDVMKEALLYRASSDGTEIHAHNEQLKHELSEPDLEEAYMTINKFLKKKKLNIYKDINEIINILKNNPLRETLVGMCTKAMGTLCERQDRLATLEKWYYLSQKVPNIVSFDFTYRRFIDKAKIVEHNKAIYELEPNQKRHFELEYQALTKFYQNILCPEFKVLCEEVNTNGEEYIASKYPNLKGIVSQISEIHKEIQEWVMKLKLENSSTNEPNNLVLI